MKIYMGTEKHSKASRARWANVSKKDRFDKMSHASRIGWGRLDAEARSKRAMKTVRTRKENLEKNNK